MTFPPNIVAKVASVHALAPAILRLHRYGFRPWEIAAVLGVERSWVLAVINTAKNHNGAPISAPL